MLDDMVPHSIDSGFIRLSVQRAMVGNVSANLAGLYANVEGNLLKVSAYFFEMPSEEDLQLTEEIAAEVIGDLPETFHLMTQNGLISEAILNTIKWNFLRAEASS